MKPAAPFAALAAALLAGCTVAEPPPAPLPFSVEPAAGPDTRSLHDDALGHFLTANLGGPSAPGVWDFETLAWVAFYYHPSLGLARAEWELARASGQTATARPNPTLSLVPGYNSTREPGLSPWFPAVNFDFLLQSRAQRAHQADLARAETEAARLAVLATAWQVRAGLRRALTDLGYAGRRETLLRAQVEITRNLHALLEQRLAAGRAASAEVSAAHLALVKAEAAADEAHASAATARVHVAAALGLPVAALDGVELPLPPAMAQLTPGALAVARRASLQSRAGVLAALAHYQSVQAALELAVAQRQPGIHLGPGYQWDQGANKWSLPLTFELPLFQRNEGPVAEAVARRAEAAAQFTAAQASAIAAIDAAAAAQAAAVTQHGHLRRLRDGAQTAAGLARQRLALGASDQVEFQSASLDAASADLALLDGETAAALAAGELEDALQVPFPNLANLSRPP